MAGLGEFLEVVHAPPSPLREVLRRQGAGNAHGLLAPKEKGDPARRISSGPHLTQKIFNPKSHNARLRSTLAATLMSVRDDYVRDIAAARQFDRLMLPQIRAQDHAGTRINTFLMEVAE